MIEIPLWAFVVMCVSMVGMLTLNVLLQRHCNYLLQKWRVTLDEWEKTTELLGQLHQQLQEERKNHI